MGSVVLWTRCCGIKRPPGVGLHSTLFAVKQLFSSSFYHSFRVECFSLLSQCNSINRNGLRRFGMTRQWVLRCFSPLFWAVSQTGGVKRGTRGAVCGVWGGVRLQWGRGPGGGRGVLSITWAWSVSCRRAGSGPRPATKQCQSQQITG